MALRRVKSTGKDAIKARAKAYAPSAGANAGTFSSSDTARYVADICAEMAVMAKAADLALLAHLLSMAQAEAERAAQANPPRFSAPG